MRFDDRQVLGHQIEHQRRDLLGQAATLGRRYEDVRPHRLGAIGALPSQQRLRAYPLLGPDIDDGLVDQIELPVPYRPAQQLGHVAGPSLAPQDHAAQHHAGDPAGRGNRPSRAREVVQIRLGRNGHHRHMLEPRGRQDRQHRARQLPDHGLSGRRALQPLRLHVADAEKAVGFAGIEQADGRGRLEQRHGVHVVAAIQEYRVAVEGERDVPQFRRGRQRHVRPYAHALQRHEVRRAEVQAVQRASQ